ncbi:MAG: DUF4410 domain-containing protein [Pseudomonadota bacterium]
MTLFQSGRQRSVLQSGKRRATRIALAAFFVCALSACGTTTPMEARDGSGDAPDLGAYTGVVIGEFNDRATEGRRFKDADSDKKALYEAEVAQRADEFADKIEFYVASEERFARVDRDREPTASDIVIEGDILTLKPGNPLLRLAIPWFAGKVKFEAVVRVRDGATSDMIGTIVVDRYSLVGGGVWSLSQSVDSLMNAGAKAVAKRVTAEIQTRVAVAPVVESQGEHHVD